jgi:hypothetical protein
MKAFDGFLVKYFPEGNRADDFVVAAYNRAETLVVPVGNSILLATDIESGDAPALCQRSVA